MCSAASTVPRDGDDGRKDLTAEARIRLVALELFGQNGVDATSVRAVANAAGVSPALVIHHFESKAGLVEAVDRYVVDRSRELIDGFAESAASDDALGVISTMSSERGLLDYFLRQLTHGGASGDALFEAMHQVTLDTIEAMQHDGKMRDLDDTRAAAAWMIASDFGVILLRQRLENLLGGEDDQALRRVVTAGFDAMTQSVFQFEEGNEQ